SAWWRETSGSSRTMSHDGLRPIVTTGAASLCSTVSSPGRGGGGGGGGGGGAAAAPTTVPTASAPLAAARTVPGDASTVAGACPAAEPSTSDRWSSGPRSGSPSRTVVSASTRKLSRRWPSTKVPLLEPASSTSQPPSTG